MRRRTFLTSMSSLVAAGSVVPATQAEVISKTLPWRPSASDIPTPIKQGGWQFLTANEVTLVTAIADRLIPADELSPSASEAGCVVFIDRQLAGDFGKAATEYRKGPFVAGTPQQGPQLKQTPAERYRAGLAAFDAYCQKQLGKPFAELSSNQQDATLKSLEAGQIKLTGTDGEALFNLILQNVREGFFADPIYGGNRDMVGWKMIGFPGARYDYRDVIDKRGQKLDLIPTSLINS